jgi:hypothetical protein
MYVTLTLRIVNLLGIVKLEDCYLPYVVAKAIHVTYLACDSLSAFLLFSSLHPARAQASRVGTFSYDHLQ